MSSYNECYRQYKIGTDRIVEWLVAIARDRFDLSTLLSTQHTAALGDDSVHANDIVRLARAVARNRYLQLPAWFLDTLENVIVCRRFCYTHNVADHGTPSPEDRGHAHFIVQLEHVQEILQQIPSVVAARVADIICTTSERQLSTQNLEMVRTIEDSPSPQAATPPSSPSSSDEADSPRLVFHPQTPRAKAKVGDVRSRSELVNHYRQLQNCREVITEAWARFAARKIGFATASSVTGMGIMLMRAADCRFTIADSESWTWQRMAESFGVTVVVPNRSPVIYVCAKDAIETDDLSQLLCIPATVVLDILSDRSDAIRKNIDLYGKGKKKKKYPELHSCHHKPVYWQLYKRPFVQQLLGMLGSLEVPVFDPPEIRYGDDLPDGIRQALSTSTVKPEMWVYSVVQTLIDVAPTFEANSSVCIDTFTAQSVLCREACEAMKTYKADRPLRDERMLLYISKLEELAERTEAAVQVLQLQTHQYDQGDMHSAVFGEQKEYFEKLNNPFVGSDDRGSPFQAGMMLHIMQLEQFIFATQLADLDGSIRPMAYLYKAMRASGYLDCSWPDMELLISAQSKSHPFFRRVDPSSVGKIARGYLGSFSDKQVTFDLPFSDLLYDSYHEMDITGDRRIIEAFLQRSAASKQENSGIAEWLSSAQDHMMKEEGLLAFPLISFMVECGRLFWEIDALVAAGENARMSRGQLQVETSFELNTLVLMGKVVKDQLSEHGQDDVLTGVGSALKRHIERKGAMAASSATQYLAHAPSKPNAAMIRQTSAFEELDCRVSMVGSNIFVVSHPQLTPAGAAAAGDAPQSSPKCLNLPGGLEKS